MSSTPIERAHPQPVQWALPVRMPGEIDWSGPVPGDTSATLWTEIHPYDDLPKVIDPDSGWVQNSNSPPWYTPYPAVFDPDLFTPTNGAEFSPSATSAVSAARGESSLSLERMVELQYSTRMELADCVVDDLVTAAQHSVRTWRSRQPTSWPTGIGRRCPLAPGRCCFSSGFSLELSGCRTPARAVPRPLGPRRPVGDAGGLGRSESCRGSATDGGGTGPGVVRPLGCGMGRCGPHAARRVRPARQRLLRRSIRHLPGPQLRLLELPTTGQVGHRRRYLYCGHRVRRYRCGPRCS